MDGINKRKFFRVWRARLKMSRLLIGNAKPFQSSKNITAEGMQYESIGVCKNISAGGILFESMVPMLPGSLLDFKIALAGFSKYRSGDDCTSDEICGQAKVIRVQPAKSGPEFDIAMEFMDLDQNTRQALDNFIRSHKP
ncbi:MAG: PilZ domain-containing protein [Elusimicrobia bacterium]|nr:PilZ domain-containing protein [Elusimicrobiota bacterium]